jgi:hypothetical protein
MKHCPKCRSSYADDTLKFCLQDGTSLVGSADSHTETPTLAFGQSGQTTEDEVTEQFFANEPTERFTTNKDARQMRVNVPESSAENWEKSRETQLASYPAPPPPPRSNTLVTILVTALVMLIFFGVAGIGAWWFYLPKDRNQIAENANNQPTGNEKIITKDADAEKDSPTPAPTKKDSDAAQTPVKTATPPPNFDAEEVKKQVSDRIFSWKSLAESRNLNAYMESYDENLDYYNKKGASKNFVRNDKQKAFTQYDSIKMNFSNLSITPDKTGETATAVFDKAWVFQNFEKTSEGKVQTQLKLRNTGGVWKITSERDLKVYFVK